MQQKQLGQVSSNVQITFHLQPIIFEQSAVAGFKSMGITTLGKNNFGLLPSEILEHLNVYNL